MKVKKEGYHRLGNILVPLETYGPALEKHLQPWLERKYRAGVRSVTTEQLCSDLDGLFDKMTALKNRDLLYALYRHVWELREEVMLLRKYLSWRKAKPGARPRYRDAGYRPGIFRGGLAAQLQRLLPMDEEGCFRHPSLSVAKNKSNGSRAL